MITKHVYENVIQDGMEVSEVIANLQQIKKRHGAASTMALTFSLNAHSFTATIREPDRPKRKTIKKMHPAVKRKLSKKKLSRKRKNS